MPLNAVEMSKEQQRGWKRLGFERVSKKNNFDTIVVRNPQSAASFIFIGRGGCTPSKSGYKRTLEIKSNLIRITQDQTAGQTGWPSAMPILAANICPPAF